MKGSLPGIEIQEEDSTLLACFSERPLCCSEWAGWKRVGRMQRPQQGARESQPGGGQGQPGQRSEGEGGVGNRAGGGLSRRGCFLSP